MANFIFIFLGESQNTNLMTGKFERFSDLEFNKFKIYNPCIELFKLCTLITIIGWTHLFHETVSVRSYLHELIKKRKRRKKLISMKY